MDAWRGRGVTRFGPEAQVKHIGRRFLPREACNVVLGQWGRRNSPPGPQMSGRVASCCSPPATSAMRRGRQYFPRQPMWQGRHRSWPRCDDTAALLRSSEEAWQHWCRVWEVDIDWMRFALLRQDSDGEPGIPARWFDARCCEGSGQSARHLAGNVRDGAWRQYHHQNAGKPFVNGKARLLVVWRPLPDAWSVALERRNGDVSLAACTALRWTVRQPLPTVRCMGRADRQADLRMQERLRCDVHAREEIGLADRMFKNIKVENGAVPPRIFCARFNRADGRPDIAASRRAPQSPHEEQAKFDLVSSGRRRDDPEVGAILRFAVAVLGGTPEFRHPGTAILYTPICR